MDIYRQDQEAYQKASWFRDIRLRDENNKPLRLSEGEKIVFGIKRSFIDDHYIVKKVLSATDEINGVYPVMLTPEELDVLPNRYWYDIGVQCPDGPFIKIVPKSVFHVNESYTEKEVV